MRLSLIATLIPLLLPSLSKAAPILSDGEWYIGDGGTYDASAYPNAGFNVQLGTLNILPGATVLSVNGAGSGASVVMSGGQVQSGITVSDGSLNVSGGQITGFDSTAYGGNAVFVSSSAQISGGTFTGGNSSGQAGSAIVASAGTINGTSYLSSLIISGGTFTGGTGSGGYYGGSTGYSLESLGNTTVTGGHFLSPIAINTSNGGETDFFGSHLSYQNDILSGLLQNGDPIHVQIYPDFTSANVNASGTEVSFVSSTSGSTSTSTSTSASPQPSPIPEPGSALVFGSLAAFFLARQRLRRGPV